MKVKVEYWKQTGKWYTTEEIEIPHLDELESTLKRGFVSSTYIIEDDGHIQPYRVYLL